MKLNLYEIVMAVTQDEQISEKELIDTVEFLMEEVCQERRTLFKVGEMIQKMVDYEKAPVS